MLPVLRPITPLSIASDGYLSARRKACLRLVSNQCWIPDEFLNKQIYYATMRIHFLQGNFKVLGYLCHFRVKHNNLREYLLFCEERKKEQPRRTL